MLLIVSCHRSGRATTAVPPTAVVARPDRWQDTISSMDLQDTLEQVRAEIASSIGEGSVADYIPSLASVDPQQFGMAVASNDGEVLIVGYAARAVTHTSTVTAMSHDRKVSRATAMRRWLTCSPATATSSVRWRLCWSSTSGSVPYR